FLNLQNNTKNRPPFLSTWNKRLSKNTTNVHYVYIDNMIEKPKWVNIENINKLFYVSAITG
ncbi:MAG: hypothetical protein EAZ64_01180, partial [Sphingobacteriales bacterium]